MRAFLFSLLIAVSLASCNSNSRYGKVIPHNEFRDILIDIHLIDASYMANSSKYSFHNDTVNFYNDILSRYGYNKAIFDSSVRYYVQQQKEFDIIYEEIITELNKLQNEVYLLQRFEVDTSQILYKSKKQWFLPKDGTTEKIPFDVVLKKNDTIRHSIFVQLKVYKDDKSRNPHLTAYYWYNNGSKDGYREYFPEIEYEKSNKGHSYSTSLRPKNKKVTHIRGYVLDTDWKPFFNKKHIDVKSIIVSKNWSIKPAIIVVSKLHLNFTAMPWPDDFRHITYLLVQDKF